MKKISVLIIVLLLQSCINIFGEPATTDVRVSQYTPVFMERDEFESSVALQNSNTIGEAGKIYVYNDYLFINEKNEGFHIFNNSNPSNPTAIKFIKSPGATDLAIKNNSIYINQATDLIAIELGVNLQSITVTKRIQNVFTELLSPDGFRVDTPDGKVLVKWVLN